MKLEEIVKSLEVGEYVKVELKEAALIRVVQLWRNDKGKYNFIFDGYNLWRNDKGKYNFMFEGYNSSNEFETAEEVLKSISENFGGKWLEYDYEIYKTRAELKAENAKLKEKLEKVSKEYEAVWRALTE